MRPIRLLFGGSVLVASATMIGGSAGSPAQGSVVSPARKSVMPALDYPAPPRRLLAGQHAYSSWVRVKVTPDRTQVVRVNYLLYAPGTIGINRTREWPLIVFLHGYGERGADPQLLTAQPLPGTLAHTTGFPAIVFSPQLPLQFTGWSEMIGPVDALVQRLAALYPVDRRRLYLTGLSTGGYGTWTYALRHPNRFAALVPIAGGYEQGGVPRNICALHNTPIWAFHGALDTIITPYHSEILVRALRACGSKVVRFTLFAGVGHFHSWIHAYADPALWRWLFSQRLP